MLRVRTFVSIASVILVATALQSDAVAQTGANAATQTVAVVAHSTDVSANEAALHIDLSDRKKVTVSFRAGQITMNGRRIADYDSGGSLESAWRALLDRAAGVGPSEILQVVRDWTDSFLSEEDAERVGEELAELRAPLPAPSPRPRLRAPTDLRIDLGGLEALEGLEGLESLAALEAIEALKGLDVEALRDEINAQLSARQTSGAEAPLVETYVQSPTIASQIAGDIAGLLAAFIAMCSLGFGLVFFASRQLEVVADTVRHAFWRSFLVGLLAQPLVIPLFGLLMLGLALTVVGLLVIPFAALAFVTAAFLGVLGGYLAVARSIGEAYLRGRMAMGHQVGGWLSYRYMVYGLVALSTVWLPAVLLGWAPVAGEIFMLSAILLSWIVATAGFGATILSRAGIRGTFGGRFDQALSDEYLYRTPHATPVARASQHPNRFES